MEPVSTEVPASKIMSEVNHALLVHFLDAIETNEFCSCLNLVKLHAKLFLKWIMSLDTISAKTFVDVMRAKASASSKSLKLTMFACFSDPNLQKTGLEQVQQILWTPLAVATYAEEVLRARELFRTLFSAGQISAALINAG